MARGLGGIALAVGARDDAARAPDRRDRLRRRTPVNKTKLSPANIVILGAGVRDAHRFVPRVLHVRRPASLGGSTSYNAWSTGQFLIATLSRAVRRRHGGAGRARGVLERRSPRAGPRPHLGPAPSRARIPGRPDDARVPDPVEPVSFGIGFWLMLLAGSRSWWARSCASRARPHSRTPPADADRADAPRAEIRHG